VSECRILRRSKALDVFFDKLKTDVLAIRGDSPQRAERVFVSARNYHGKRPREQIQRVGRRYSSRLAIREAAWLI